MFSLVKKSAFALGLNASPHVGASDVMEVVAKLKPQDCGIDLVRIGPPGDGGYLIPNDLEGVRYCFSPGVSTMCDFEDQIADLGINSFMADYSVQGPPKTRPEFVFDKKFLGSRNDDMFMTLSKWKDKYIKDYDGDLMLQMDIEGYEYEVIANASDELLDQFRIIVIEFHHIVKLLDKFGYIILASTFEKLLKSFYVAHIHPNNMAGIVKKGPLEIPDLLEITFINKKRVSRVKPAKTFPHPLDVENTDKNPPMPLPACWIG